MKTKDKIIFSILAFATFCWIIYLVKSVLAPFICSLIIAYFLNPLVNYMAMKYRMSRLVATSLILGLFFTILIGTCSVLLPIIYTQFSALIMAIPGYLKTITDDFYPKVAMALNEFGFKLQVDFSNLLTEEKIDSKLIELSQSILGNAFASSGTLLNILSLVFVTPILIFYLLKDWNIIVNKVQYYLPHSLAHTAERLFKDIDRTLSNYVRGQLTVCLLLGMIYASMLSFTGLNFGFLIGFLTGIFAFIPYIGMLCGISTAIVVALFQWGFDINHIGAVAIVFAFGQLIESNFLTPKLLGAKIGLHPVWLIFGLFFFGALFGFIGVLIAVPLTAICSVIIKHFALKYKQRFAD